MQITLELNFENNFESTLKPVNCKLYKCTLFCLNCTDLNTIDPYYGMPMLKNRDKCTPVYLQIAHTYQQNVVYLVICLIAQSF